ncbi:MAG TPA: hypothetical protein VFA48_04165 [Gammaproteobacteria bacterium]|nr:hypothetical protein [Gammaproteobacteria bacterium]
MSATAYTSEDVLQGLIARYPNLLAGGQMDSTNPRRWLLLSREASVPDNDEGSERWSLDHLFVDQEAIPTLVEVKRSSDTRLRREVVAQMLDYAANGMLYWRVETLREKFYTRCKHDGLDPDVELRAFLGTDADVDAFWADIKTRLQAQQIRLVFVADVIPPELLRIVEFLNGQMDPAEVIAVEIKQYRGGELTTLVPRVLGKTAEATQRKAASGPRIPWTHERFRDALSDPRDVVVFDTLLDWVGRRGLDLQWGTGASQGTVYPIVDCPLGNKKPVGLLTPGKVQIDFSILNEPQVQDAKRGLQQKLNALPGINIADAYLSTWKTFGFSALYDDSAMRQFLEAFEEFIGQIRALSEDR